MFGFLNIYKPKGMTSHDVVSVLRRITKIKQIGHTGTLDPFAEGVLPICIGKSTRLIEYLEDDKAYIGTVQFGKATDTYDIDGTVTKTSDKKISLAEIESVLSDFRGEIEQKPPIYSAIKIKGKKLYELARAGKKDIEIPSRRVYISKLEIVSFNPQQQSLELTVECSKGTYIRSIANDIGERLGVCGHLTKLVRIKAGKFLLENSTPLASINTVDDIQKLLINPLEYLDYPKYEINPTEQKKISNGMSIKIPLPDGISLMTVNNNIAAVGKCKSNIFECDKVFINNN